MNPTASAGPSLLSVTATAAALGVCEKTIRKMIDAGQLATVQVGGRRRIRRDTLEALIGPLNGQATHA